MGIFLNSTAPFEAYKITALDKYFVDKTMLIEELIPSIGREQRFLCITRPRRFGKTVMANMVASYFGKAIDSSFIFEHLAIAKSPVYEEYINKYDVIYIDFSRLPENFQTYEEYINRIKTGIKEDLFEAIIGAVAIDSGWNLKDLQKVVEVMLVPEDFLINDTDTNYVRLIQEWEMNENGCIPWYKYKEASCSSTWYLKEGNTIYQSFPLDYNYSKLKYYCYLKLLDSLPVFCGFGVSIREARMAACKLAYEYLERNDMLPSIRDEIENPNRDDAINQLETLARRGYFSIPTYEFKETYDNNGNPIWNCECRIAEEDYYFDGTSSSKKEAKKDSAFRMLFYVLGMEDE